VLCLLRRDWGPSTARALFSGDHWAGAARFCLPRPICGADPEPAYWQGRMRTPSSIPRTGAAVERILAVGSQARRYMASTWKSGTGTPGTLLPVPKRWPLTTPGSWQGSHSGKIAGAGRPRC
jgi:hypothetical protein